MVATDTDTDTDADTDIVDIAALAHGPLLAGLSNEELGAVLHRLERTTVPAGTILASRGAPDDALGFVLGGEARVDEPGVAVRRLGPGSHWGELVLAGAATHPITVVTTTEARVARFARAGLADLARTNPQAALHLTQALLRVLAGSAPAEIAAPVVRRATAPIAMETWVGRGIFGRSAGLALLEAARELGMDDVRLGPSITTGRVVSIGAADLATAAPILNAAVQRLVERDVPYVEETWDVEAAIAHFLAHGDQDAAAVLAGRRDPSVTLVGCGDARAIGTGPVLPSTGHLAGVGVVPYPDGLLLDFGDRVRSSLPARPFSTIVLERKAPRYGAEMTLAERRWLELLGVTSVGSFNRACVSGRVREIVHVSEGFHEKHIAQVADDVKARSDARIIAVAGPSSSGKTTFIKRLKVQLEVVGIHPLELSLDDYYMDRERAPRDADGQLDFEAIEALDLDLLDDHVRRLIRGEQVRTARFDFLSGRSAPAGGRELGMGPDDVLLVEGIHGLDPSLLASVDAAVFRIFIHVATSLRFDRLSWLEPADLRLLRRIVRDRHQRGTTATETLARWPSVRRGERLHILAHQGNADRVFDSSLIYEASVLKVFAERYLLEVPRDAAEHAAAQHLRRLLDPIVPIEPDHVPPTSILREFIGQSGFSY